MTFPDTLTTQGLSLWSLNIVSRTQPHPFFSPASPAGRASSRSVRGFYNFFDLIWQRAGAAGTGDLLAPRLKRSRTYPGPQSSQSGVFNPWAGSSKQLKTHFSSMFQASKGSLLTLRAGRVRAGGELSAEHQRQRDQRGSMRGSAIRILVRDGDLRTSMWCRTHGLRVNTRGHVLLTGSIQGASKLEVSRNTQGPKHKRIRVLQ